MANNFKILELDTFTSAIDVNASLGFPTGTLLCINSIEWQVPTTVDHTALITDDADNPIFSETCVTAKQSIIKYFHGAWVNNLKIAISGVGSGAIKIVLC